MSGLAAVAYPDLETAREVASNIGEAQKAHLIERDDLVIVERRGDGKTSCTGRPSPPSAPQRRAAGLIGLNFFMPLFGIGIGAAAGAAAGAMSDASVDDKFMKDFGTKSESGGAEVIAPVRQANMERLLADVRIPGEVLQTSLSRDAEQALSDTGAPA